jgi:ribosomal protein L5
MWKKYNNFYTQTIKSEVGFTQLCKNVNQIPCIKKVSLTCVCKTPNNIKNVLMTLSALQLVVNRKAKVVTSKQSLAQIKIRKGQPLGAKICLTGGTALQFF